MTRAEKQWCDAIANMGCIVCLREGLGPTPAAVHHILKSGRRQSHLETIPLCPVHHQHGGHGQISRHPNRTAFERRYGTEAELLADTKRRIAERFA